MKIAHYLLPLILYSISLYATPIISNNAIHHPVVGKYGMVATQERHATQVGLNLLKQGGNAIDAAVAIGFTLAVTHPQAGNLGGGGFMMIHIASENRTIALDFRETAPKNAHKHMFLNSTGNVDTQLSRFSLQSSGVPGSVHGLLTALNDFGSMPRKKVIQPAIKLAKGGIVVSNELSNSLKRAKKRLMKDPTIRPIFYPNNNALDTGEKLIQKDLAKSLKRISKHGKTGFYEGKTANQLSNFMKNNNGLISKSDLKNYRSKYRKPIKVKYRDTHIYSMPPPSSGGIIMAQILKLIEPYPLKKWGHNSAKTIHIMSEAMQLAYTDRAGWLGDDDFVNVPKKDLLSPVYIRERRKKIQLNRHSPSINISHGNLFESDETTHYSVVDQWGNAVSVTTTLNFSFGSGIAIPGTGILLNNEMDDFSAKPGVPNAYGLIGNERNAIAPNKRMLSSMTPTIVLKNNQVFLVTGSPGGSRIITTVTQIISNVIDHNMNIAEASHASRFHHQWQPDELRIEPNGLSNDTLKKLQRLGHNIKIKRVMGSTQSIIKQNGRLYGSSDPRTPSGLTLGY
ncbi:gamma-glutamyltransferase [Candidatus Marinamargulisbacteria bacterium SCGC AG-343-K17]|nr:gamma-glutamyltransferase [Candidatus Marinamargulisbacteria bacterium SCGC AG-343-K17]